LDTQTLKYFTDIIQSANALFTGVEQTVDTTPERTILRLQAMYGEYRLYITELVDRERRKYRYYVLKGEYVVVGFDNSPDPRVIRLKYGYIGEHAGEYIPHCHEQNKTVLQLTDSLDFPGFVAWLQHHLPIKT
jgi:hypothetical protein